MDKLSASRPADALRDGFPSMQFDGRRLLADPEARAWQGIGASPSRLPLVEQVRGQLRAIAFAAVLSLLLLVLAVLTGQLLPRVLPPLHDGWLLAALLCGVTGPVAWLLSGRQPLTPRRATHWRLAAAVWAALALLTWGLGFGHALTLPWSEGSVLLLSGLALGAAMLLMASAHWRTGLIAGWAALLLGQLLAGPADGWLVPALGFDLVLLGLAMVLGQMASRNARLLVAERASRRELAQLKAAGGEPVERPVAEVRQANDVERALQEARAEAEVANRAKTEFLATMSHEVRTPLNGIVPILEMLRETRLEDDQRELLDTAYKSSRHLLRIINDVLDYAKAESGKLELESIEIDLRELLESVTQLMAKSAERRGLRLHCRIAEDVPRRVRGDPIRLRQVLSNLVSNAIKFTERGEISIDLHRRRSSRKEVELVFGVNDTGAGMSRETQRRLFRAFSQGDASTTRKHGGTGLGLVICKRLVELMGGRIGVKSQQGEGSTFWFVLPMRKSASEVPPARRDLAGLRVLSLVDDDAVAGQLAEALHAWGMSQQRVKTLPAAMARLSSSAQLGTSWAPQLLIVSLPASGQALRRLVDELRADAALAELKIVVVTPSMQMLRELPKLPGLSVAQAPIDSRQLQRQLYRLFDVEGGRLKSDEDTEALFDSLALDFDAEDSASDVAHPLVRGEVLARALLVEDNPVNLSVARRMLAKLGVESLVARDGLEALDVLQRDTVDLVLMDCQMPNMDGYEATRRIRAGEQRAGQARHLPIVAMTANVMSGDREQCLDAGMDDYLGKPLEFASLRRALEPWVRLRQQGDGVEPPAAIDHAAAVGDQASAAGGGSSPLDLHKLAQLRQLMGDELPRLIRQFLDTAAQLMAAVDQAAREDDLRGMGGPAHSLKSSSANLGAMQLSEAAARLEQACADGEAAAARRTHQTLQAAFGAACAALRTELG